MKKHLQGCYNAVLNKCGEENGSYAPLGIKPTFSQYWFWVYRILTRQMNAPLKKCAKQFREKARL